MVKSPILTLLLLMVSIFISSPVHAGAEAEYFRGFYIFGHEVRTFQPCGSDQVYWVRADTAIWQKLRSEHERLTTKPYEPIFIEVQGHVIGRATEGFAGDYSGQIFLQAIEVARAKQNNDCNASAASDDNLLGIVWKWQQTLYNNDQRAVPNDPSGYTIVFQPDGTLAIRADCNRAGANYTLENSSLTITVTHSTRAMCPPDSLEQTFLKDLDAAAIYFIRKGQLYIDLKYDTGTMRFSK